MHLYVKGLNWHDLEVILFRVFEKNKSLLVVPKFNQGNSELYSLNVERKCCKLRKVYRSKSQIRTKP